MAAPYQRAVITEIDPNSPAVSSAGVLNTNWNDLQAADDSLNVLAIAFYLSWAPAGGLFVSGASPGNLPSLGTGLTINLAGGSQWLINGNTLTLGGSPVVISSIPDNSTNYIYVTLNSSGVPVFANASATPNPQTGKCCIGLVTAAGGAVTTIDTTKTDTVPTLPYLLSLANSGGGGGGSFDPSALWAAFQALQATVNSLQNQIVTGGTTAVNPPFDVMLQEQIVQSVNQRLVDPVAGDDSFVVVYAPGISGDDSTRPDGTNASDARGGGTATDDVQSHTVGP